MTRTLSIVLLLSFLLTATEGNQLLKLPFLLKHYTEHKALNAEISFLQFLGMHYGGDDEVESDNERDAELPFKRFENPALTQMQSTPAGQSNTGLLLSSYISVRLIADKQFDLPANFASSIWQPPRSC